MRSLQDLSEFHLSFNAISAYLMANQLLSSCKQSQCYLHVFKESLQNKIMMCLHIKLSNHHPSLPYDIEEVYEAAKWVLQAVPATLGASFATNQSTPTPASETGFIKQEQLSAFLSDLTKTLADAMGTNCQCPCAVNTSTPAAPRATNNKCMFDGCDASSVIAKLQSRNI
jgi:hypothetical protein